MEVTIQQKVEAEKVLAALGLDRSITALTSQFNAESIGRTLAARSDAKGIATAISHTLGPADMAAILLDGVDDPTTNTWIAAVAERLNAVMKPKKAAPPEAPSMEMIAGDLRWRFVDIRGREDVARLLTDSWRLPDTTEWLLHGASITSDHPCREKATSYAWVGGVSPIGATRANIAMWNTKENKPVVGYADGRGAVFLVRSIR